MSRREWRSPTRRGGILGSWAGCCSPSGQTGISPKPFLPSAACRIGRPDASQQRSIRGSVVDRSTVSNTDVALARGGLSNPVRAVLIERRTLLTWMLAARELIAP